MTKPDMPSSGSQPRDPQKLKSGEEEPITPAQRAELETLCREASEDLPEDVESLSKAEAALLIDELQRRTGRLIPGA